MRSKTTSARTAVLRVALALAIGVLTFSSTASSEPRTITVASTTSTQNSGLFEWLLPQFTKATGIEVQGVAVGTGQAIRIATNGDADLLLVHHEASERKFVADGLGLERHPVMHNDFVLVGPGVSVSVEVAVGKAVGVGGGALLMKIDRVPSLLAVIRSIVISPSLTNAQCTQAPL